MPRKGPYLTPAGIISVAQAPMMSLAKAEGRSSTCLGGLRAWLELSFSKKDRVAASVAAACAAAAHVLAGDSAWAGGATGGDGEADSARLPRLRLLPPPADKLEVILEGGWSE